MLAPEHRLRSSTLFSHAVKRGKKKGSRTVVVYLWVPKPEDYGTAGIPLASPGGPRTGLIVSKAVGNAVARHAVSRRLRAALDELITQRSDLPDASLIIIRALPKSSKAATKELFNDVSKCIDRLLR